MSENFWKKLQFITGLFPLAAIFGWITFAANAEIKDLDLWLHLAMGKFIAINHFVPDYDVLSATIQGAPWINHEWLFQVLIYKIHTAFGFPGLIQMQVVLVTATLLVLLFTGYQKEKLLSLTFMLLMVGMVYQQRFTIRPDLFSLFFFALYIFILALHIDKKWCIPVLFVLQVIWSNMHGFFFFGPLFILLGIVSEWIKRHCPLPYEWNESGRLENSEYRRLIFSFFVVILACLLNPAFVKGAVYPLGVFFSLSGENKIFFQYIVELQKPFALSEIFDKGVLPFYKLLIFISFISFVFNRKKIDISALFIWIVFLVFSLKAVRNIPFFAFAAYLVFITNAMHISLKDFIPLRFTHPKFKYITVIILQLFLLIWVLQYIDGMFYRAYYDFDKKDWKSSYGGISLRSYPDKAVDFLKDNEIKGNFFNDFNSGAYLLGRVYPDIKVFIDGRTEVYGGKFFKEVYRKIMEEGDVDVFEEIVQKYHLTGALLNSSRQDVPKKLLKYLYKSKDWHLVYFNYDGLVFLKDTQANHAIIKEFEMDLSKWDAQLSDLFAYGTSRVVPYHNYYRAFTLESLDLQDQALSELRQALRVTPGYPEAQYLTGKIYLNKGEYAKAFENARLAAMMKPQDARSRYMMAEASFYLKEYDQALKECDKIKRKWSRFNRIDYLRARIYFALKDVEKAQELIKMIKEDKGVNLDEFFKIAEGAVTESYYDVAKDVLTFILEKDAKKLEAKKLLDQILVDQKFEK